MTGAVSVVLAFLIGALGVGGALVVVIAANPEKVQIWASLIWGVLRRATKRAEYAYIASDVAGRINAHLATEILPSVTGLSSQRIAVRWDNTAEAVEREIEGTLIIRLKPHEDRLYNVLRAYLVAVPRLFAPQVRSQLGASQSRAIDLQLCRRLAETLSQSAITVYRVNILDPELRKDPTLGDILDSFRALELGGLFVPILLQELIKLGSTYPADMLPELPAELDQFVQFLRTVAERGRGEDVELSNLGRHIRINVILVARIETRIRGVHPYRTRVSRGLAMGVNTFYLLATGGNVAFARTVASALDADRRLLRHDERRVLFHRDGEPTEGIVIPFERNSGYCISDELTKRVDSGKFAIGTRHQVLITDVQPSYVTVDIDGSQGIIPIDEISWQFVQTCAAELGVGEEIEVEIVDVRPDEHELVASRRLCLPNPFTDVDTETLRGTRRVFVVTGRGGREPGRRFVAGYLKGDSKVPAMLYESELEWGAPFHGVNHISDNDEIEVVVYEIETGKRFALCSRKRLSGEKWNQIREKYPRGRAVEAKVSGIVVDGVWCELEPGLAGFVPAQEFQIAGLEYRNFRTNVHPGQTLYVYVSRVVAGEKQRVNLGLQANK